MEQLTPKEIVAELDKYIVGQKQAKRAVAIALRNRYRRSLLPAALQEDVLPKNILMIGPTGVGKTEIARRLAKLVKAPFTKVEATKFTEVGYVGRDVESIIRDLTEIALRMVKSEKMQEVEAQAEVNAEKRLLTILVPGKKKESSNINPFQYLFNQDNEPEKESPASPEVEKDREFLKEKLQKGELEEHTLEIEVEESSQYTDMLGASGMELGVNIQDMMAGMFPKKRKKRKVTVKEARRILAQEEAQNLIDQDEAVQEAIRRTEQEGIVFIDEIDKIAGKESSGGPDVSRGGVQRDILPLIEGSTVMTKYGPVRTDHILFIAAGAFHVAKPSDLIPELQGRLPIRVELESLSVADFKRILIEPQASLIKQYGALLSTEGIDVIFSENAIEEIAQIAYNVNAYTENIGARRLHTIVEKVLEELSFEASELPEDYSITINREYIQKRVGDVAKNQDLSNYIL
ncbi:MAG: ATP-dependent protease ATPase subunit HslU [Dehalobacter sp. 4CP]|jgi:ATP-dependent HslUV protease ATP-binding subunit HslU|uniref:ATP-dependent protease ATPase subunit HslU n=2 Tax=Dehalobacter restrictus TaxID=55583 RepID=A0A857DI80_9FIRM|nr:MULTISPECIES: ATP-dependent protease ATPase subunit HslU [Dehalobacter]NBJ15607.1 ATP-dependent protease ATPase subunit HslU [Dehalobacter sp. 4CP]AHF09606.1 ATP-dependent protease [Dehalobacter restrictus DSM 9455]MCG1026567.1 ATP-dependent protease ATPase subunit HslU [Dehalobacter sp.]MDJ0304356.1 ATP-dependent protease ATPase subunit HslU [Dehalobacter sp.]OCZ54945.1 HslU--HslV peptidase ATPase subunit [Dehalobacter sp. TeCB1]